MRIVDEPTTGLARVTAARRTRRPRSRAGKLAGLIAHARHADSGLQARSSTRWPMKWCSRSTRCTTPASRSAASTRRCSSSRSARATGRGRRYRLNAAVIGHPSLVAAGGVAGTPGDNTQARGLANLRDAKRAGRQHRDLRRFWSRARLSASDRTQPRRTARRRARGEVVRQIENLHDSVSGVSLDEEAAAMMRFQRAYEANARFFSVDQPDTRRADESWAASVGDFIMRVTFSSSLPQRPARHQPDGGGARASAARRCRRASSSHAAQDNPGAMSSSITRAHRDGVLDHYVKAERLGRVAPDGRRLRADRHHQADHRGAGARRRRPQPVLTPTQREALAGEIRGSRDAILTAASTPATTASTCSRAASRPRRRTRPGRRFRRYQGDAHVTYRRRRRAAAPCR